MDNNTDAQNKDIIISEEKNIFKDNLIINDIKKENSSNTNMNIIIDEDKKEDDDDKRLSLDIEGHDLDKYFNEGNKRDPVQKEISSSLRTIDENIKKSQNIIENSEDEINNSQKINNFDENINSSQNKISNNSEEDNFGKKTNSGNISKKNSKEEDKLIMLDEALQGSVHLPSNIQNFVNKNSGLYNSQNSK